MAKKGGQGRAAFDSPAIAKKMVNKATGGRSVLPAAQPKQAAPKAKAGGFLADPMKSGVGNATPRMAAEQTRLQGKLQAGGLTPQQQGRIERRMAFKGYQMPGQTPQAPTQVPQQAQSPVNMGGDMLQAPQQSSGGGTAQAPASGMDPSTPRGMDQLGSNPYAQKPQLPQVGGGGSWQRFEEYGGGNGMSTSPEVQQILQLAKKGNVSGISPDVQPRTWGPGGGGGGMMSGDAGNMLQWQQMNEQQRAQARAGGGGANFVGQPGGQQILKY